MAFVKTALQHGFFPFSPLFRKLRSIRCVAEAIPGLLLAAPMRSRHSVPAPAETWNLQEELTHYLKKKKKSHKVSNSEAGRVMAACKPSCGPAGEPYTAVQSPAFPLPNPNKSKPLPLQKVLLMLLMLPKKFSRGGCGT